MIVDSHVYCFTAPDTPAGHSSAQDHLEAWQLQYALHHQPAFRVRDRAAGDAQRLLDPSPGAPLRLAHGCNFRVDRTTARLVWTVAGEDFTKQQLPPNVIEYPPGAIIAEMDYAGIDYGLIHADATLTKDVGYLASCVAAYPDRLRAMAPIDEARIPIHPDKAIRQAVDAVEVHRLHGLKIIPAYAYHQGLTQPIDDATWRPFWQAVSQLRVPVFFTLGARPGSADPRQGFVDELWSLRRVLDRFPTLQASITHGYPWRAYLDGGRLQLTPEMWAPLQDTATYLEVGFPYRIGDLLPYPYDACWPVIDAMLHHLGPHRLIWGSDMPFQNRFCTYRQSRDYLEQHRPPFLSAHDLAMIMGGNAARLLGLVQPGG
jgi:predicted TIM-barrel fold metal-dependent hydrolase